MSTDKPKLSSHTITMPRLEILNIKLENSTYRTPHLLITHCPFLKTLWVHQDYKRLKLSIAECPALDNLKIKTSEPELICAKDLRALTHFCLDLSNDCCFLELDKFDREIFNFGDSSPNLKLFLLRVGNDPDHQMKYNPCKN